MDPLPFIDTRRGTPPEITADTSLIGARARIARAQVVMRPSPQVNGDSTRAVPRAAVLTVLGAAGSWLRVRLPDGEAGFVTASAVQRLGAPITVVSREAGVVLRERPSPAAVIVDSLDSRARLSVLGRYGRWLLVATEEKREGWIAE